MSYEDHRCPCGCRKERETMLCEECVREFSDRPELSDYQDKRLSLDYRRNAAMILIGLSRGSKHKRPESKRVRGRR